MSWKYDYELNDYQPIDRYPNTFKLVQLLKINF